MEGDREERIKQRAHDLWEQAGRPDGQHEEHWSQAESEIGEGAPEDGTQATGTLPTGGDAAVVATEKRKSKKV